MSIRPRVLPRIFNARRLVAAALLGLVATAAGASTLTSLPGLVVTSSADYVGYPKANILDGNYNTFWNGAGYSGWVQVDFGAAYQLDEVDLFANPLGYVNNFTVLASTDGINFGGIASGSYAADPLLGAPTVAGGPGFGARILFSGPSAPVARYLRYEQVTGPEWAYLGELSVTGHTVVPLPGTVWLLSSGVALMGARARRRTK